MLSPILRLNARNSLQSAPGVPRSAMRSLRCLAALRLCEGSNGIWSLARQPTSTHRLAQRRVTEINPVWFLNAAIVAGCGLLLAGPVSGYDRIAHPALPWFLIAVVVAATERWPVSLEFRRSAHSFSLTDVPVTLALVFCG